MKTLRLLSTTTIIAALLSACSSNPPVPESGKPPVSENNQKEMTAKNVSKPLDIQKTENSSETKEPNQVNVINDTNKKSEVSQNTPAIAAIALKQKGNQLIAKVTTDWNSAKQGDLYFKWIAPKNTTCHSTQLPITKYKDNHDLSIAKRPVTSLYTDKACLGNWSTQVVTKNGNILATQTYNVTSLTMSK